MEGYEVVGAIALALLIDAAMAYAAWRWILCRSPGRRRRRIVGTFARHCFDADADDAASGVPVADAGLHGGTFDWTHRVSDDDLFMHRHACNPATGLPMVDDAFDAAGNPYGADLHVGFDHGCEDSGTGGFDLPFETFGVSDFGSGFDSSGSGCFDSGFGGMHEW